VSRKFFSLASEIFLGLLMMHVTRSDDIVSYKATTDLRIGLTELVTFSDRLREIFKSFDFRLFQHYRLLVARDARLEFATSSGADIGEARDGRSGSLTHRVQRNRRR
jgi:hypothetical protein